MLGSNEFCNIPRNSTKILFFGKMGDIGGTSGDTCGGTTSQDLEDVKLYPILWLKVKLKVCLFLFLVISIVIGLVLISSKFKKTV